MVEPDDIELLREYAGHYSSEAAFATIVQRSSLTELRSPPSYTEGLAAVGSSARLADAESISPIRLPFLWSCPDVNDMLLEVNAFENANDLIRPVTGMRPPFTRRTTSLDLKK